MDRSRQSRFSPGRAVALLTTGALLLMPSTLHADGSVRPEGSERGSRPVAVFGEFLRAYNSPGDAALRRFFLRHATQATATERGESAERRAAWVANVRRAVPEFRPYRVVRSTPTEIEVIGRSAVTEAWYTFTI